MRPIARTHFFGVCSPRRRQQHLLHGGGRGSRPSGGAKRIVTGVAPGAAATPVRPRQRRSPDPDDRGGDRPQSEDHSHRRRSARDEPLKRERVDPVTERAVPGQWMFEIYAVRGERTIEQMYDISPREPGRKRG